MGGIGRLVPIDIVNGQNVTDMMLQYLPGSDVQIKAMTLATSASNSAAAAEHIICALHLDGEGSMVGNDLGDLNERYIEIASANRQGTIVGKLRRPVATPPHAFLWIKGQEVLDLQTLGGTMSEAADVNNAAVVVGSAVTPDNLWRAFVWRGDGPMFDLGAMDANNSAATAINDHDVVVGNLYRSPRTLQTEYRRAFQWD